MDESRKPEEQLQQDSLTFWQSFTSVFWAAFGVQKRSVWKRDMQQGSYLGFGLAIAAFLAMFIGSLLLVILLVT